jgi:hypothetical protein
MADDLTLPETSMEPAVVPAAPTATVSGPHRPRFAFVYGLLGAALAVAIALVVVYAGRAVTPAAKWSAWKPSGGGLGAAKQIADNVGSKYRLSNGDQLVDVIAKAPSVSPQGDAAIPIHYIAVRGTGGRGDVDLAISSSNSVMYSLCGLGTACSIATGKASVARGTLVRREILELALYTFKYVGGINSVIAYMPPTPGSQPQYIVFLQKSDLSAELAHPLADTLGAKVPHAAKIPAHEVHAIDAFTGTRVYKFGYSQAQNGDAILVLSPIQA